MSSDLLLPTCLQTPAAQRFYAKCCSAPSVTMISRLPHLRRCASHVRHASSTAYQIEKQGAAATAVLSHHVLNKIPSATGDKLVVNWLAAGVDPVDLAVMRGAPSAAAYAPPAFPAVPGTEGVAVVASVGPDVKSVKSGDFVIPVKTSAGTWCETGSISESDVVSVPKTIPLELAATLSASPFTAFRLLSDFGSLSPGDVVVHNNASSPVGTALVQIAKSMGIRTISLVDETSAEYSPSVERLKLMGSDVVVDEAFATSDEFKAVISDMPAPKLGINGSTIGSCDVVASLVQGGGTVVTYCLGASDDASIKSKGLSPASFSLPAWLKGQNRSTVDAMVSELVKMIEEGELTGWLQKVKFDELPHAIDEGGMMRRKLVTIMPQAADV